MIIVTYSKLLVLVVSKEVDDVGYWSQTEELDNYDKYRVNNCYWFGGSWKIWGFESIFQLYKG